MILLVGFIKMATLKLFIHFKDYTENICNMGGNKKDNCRIVL